MWCNQLIQLFWLYPSSVREPALPTSSFFSGHDRNAKCTHPVDHCRLGCYQRLAPRNSQTGQGEQRCKLRDVLLQSPQASRFVFLRPVMKTQDDALVGQTGSQRSGALPACPCNPCAACARPVIFSALRAWPGLGWRRSRTHTVPRRGTTCHRPRGDQAAKPLTDANRSGWLFAMIHH